MRNSLNVGIVLFTLLALFSCASKPKSTAAVAGDGDLTAGANKGVTFAVNADSDSGTAGALKSVYFDFNSATLSSATRATLEANAAFLKSNPSVEVQVEGHADERGSVQYNIALGEKRAKEVKNYLSAHGVEASKITTISFGKEKPVAFGHDEDSWSKNRRGNFVITAK